MDRDIERSITAEYSSGLEREARYLKENQCAKDALKNERWNAHWPRNKINKKHYLQLDIPNDTSLNNKII